MAMAILSTYSPTALIGIIASHDTAALTVVPGVGKKTAERVIVELRDKFTTGDMLDALAGDELLGDRRLHDAALALVSLGYKQDDARKMIKKLTLTPDHSVEQIVRMALTGK